jgi:hypothetical protein
MLETQRTWAGWSLDRAKYTLSCRGYEVDLEECTTSAEMLDWIMQVAGKSWATPEIVAGLVQAFADILDPQRHLCSGGASRLLTESRIRDLVKQFA